MDEVAAQHLSASGTTIEHIVDHHRQHIASDCGCLLGKDGVTAMAHPDGTVLMISEPSAGIVFITGYTPERRPAEVAR